MSKYSIIFNSIISLFIGVTFIIGAETVNRLNCHISELEYQINCYDTSVNGYKDEVKALEQKVDDCEVREQSIINNVLYNW